MSYDWARYPEEGWQEQRAEEPQDSDDEEEEPACEPAYPRASEKEQFLQMQREAIGRTWTRGKVWDFVCKYQGLAPSDIPEDENPSPKALVMLRLAKTPQGEAEFLKKVLSESVPQKLQIEQEARKYDDGRLLDRALVQAASFADNGYEIVRGNEAFVEA